MSNITEPKLNWANKWMKENKTSYINGEWVSHCDENFVHSINPANSEKLVSFAAASEKDLDYAVQSAREAFEQGPWSKMTRKERANILREIGQAIKRHDTEIATLESLDNGMLWSESYDGIMPDCTDIFDYYAGWVDKICGETNPTDEGFFNFTLYQPMGVCGAIVPWNYPILLGLWKIAPALAMGNTVLVKPSASTPMSMIRLFEILHEEVDLPKGVLNLMLGTGKIGALMGRHMGIDKMSFTGSTYVGKDLLKGSAESNLKTMTLELGGKSPNIIFDDVEDIDAVIDRSFYLTFSYKGEKCSEPTRLFVHKDHYDYVIKKMVEKANKVVCGNPFDPKSEQGPQCTESHMKSILNYIDIGIKEGAKLVAGGKRDENGNNANGFFVRPTIFADVDNKMTIAQEEIFGPVLTIHKFEDEEEVIKQANDTIYGLAAGIWTQNISRAHRVAKRLMAGQVFVNRYGMYDFSGPFGGWKQSGWGKEMAQHSLMAYTQVKSVWIKY